MNRISIQYYKTKIGEMILGSFDQQLCLLDYRYRRMRSPVDNRIKRGLSAEFIEDDNALLQETRLQIVQYLSGDRRLFSIPLLTVGTDFQKEVWKSLLEIPYGTTSTYLQQAKSINKGKAVRAVASANGANALALTIPCHRIIETSGGLGGYAGGVPIKLRLLKLEKKTSGLYNTGSL